MTTVLIDTGPIVAFLNPRDGHHDWAVRTFETLEPPLLTCDAVLAEAAYLLRQGNGAARVLELVERNVVRPEFDAREEAKALRLLLERYQNVPMDLADACLVRMSEGDRDSIVFTVDRDFRDVYRRNRRQPIPTILPPDAKRSRRSGRQRR